MTMSDEHPAPPSKPRLDDWQTFEQERREEFERALRSQDS